MFVDTFLLSDADWNTAELIQPQLTVTDINITGAIVDAMHVEQALVPDYDEWDGVVLDEWNWNTILNAQFDGSLAAGSVEADVNTTSEIRIKRRVKGTFKWYTMYVNPVDDISDFTFEWYDKTAASNVVYEYAYIPVTNGSEGSITMNEIESKFDSYFLMGVNHSYHIVVEASNIPTYNQETATQTTIGRKYPYVIKNGNVGYYSGTLSCVAVDINNCEFNFEEGELFRRDFDQFLTDGNVKILKDWQGNIWLVYITENIPRSEGNHYYLISQDISWVECGDATSIGDLYDSGFINTDLDR